MESPIQKLLQQATVYAVLSGFNPLEHQTDDSNMGLIKANFHATYFQVLQELQARIDQGLYYACIWFTDDTHAFELCNYKSHNEFIDDITSNFSWPDDVLRASFQSLIDDTHVFTLEIYLG